ncbi:hypothetical protein RND71_034453 [Anisodus tanguticus]|uniref:Uncharacterized protein n=1 Tax=Anisodus tanguticus TaxID=243964 RepID=A0AAE1V481_9SOLA|nr:hypothetical protein RND71_034453 [Anisodus tanguticus]
MDFNNELDLESIISQKELMETSASSSSPFQRTTGENYTVDTNTALKNNPEQTPQYNIQRDTDKVIFCDHCTTMTETVKRLNRREEALLEDEIKLTEKIRMLEHKIQQVQSSPSLIKMDEKGVHSTLNAVRSTTSDRDVASPAQTVADLWKSTLKV